MTANFITQHFYITINLPTEKGITMLDLQKALAQVDAIALGTKAEIQAELDSLTSDLAANTATIAANGKDDEITKTAVANQDTIIQAILDKLATAPAPTV